MVKMCFFSYLNIESSWDSLMHKFTLDEKSASILRLILGSIEPSNSTFDWTKDVSTLIKPFVTIPALKGKIKINSPYLCKFL